MTNKEAISVIENEIQIDVRLCTDEQVDRFQTALYMAISALRAEPTGDSLTLEQLRKMDGQPVWVKVIGKTGIRCDGWCEVEIREKDPFAYVWWPGSEVEDIAKIEDYGKTWACYAYPSAQIDREGWISVKERLPEGEKSVLAYYGFDRGNGDFGMRFIGTLSYFAHDPKPHWQHESTGLTVTHWMPLPEPPTELEKRMGVRG